MHTHLVAAYSCRVCLISLSELAQQTYVNATLEKLALINLMKDNEATRMTYAMRMDAGLTSKLNVSNLSRKRCSMS